jgi:internalin A
MAIAGISRFARFSLRGLAILVLLPSVWFGWQITSLRSERQAVIALGDRGSFLFREGPASDRPRLRQLLGREYRGVTTSAEHYSQLNDLSFGDLILLQKLCWLSHLRLSNVDLAALGINQVSLPPSITSLSLYDCHLTDLSFLAPLVHLEQLSLDRNPIDDGDLRVVGRRKSLTTLVLSNTTITDAGIQHLQELTSLRTIDLTNTKIGDDSLRLLSRLPSLKSISFLGTQVSDRGIAVLSEKPALLGGTLRLTGPLFTDECLPHIRELKGLLHLALEDTLVTSAGLRQIAGMPLETVFISGKNINDEALEHLAKLPRLQRLSLSGTGISDDGLRYLQSLKNLAELHAAYTKVTDAGVKAFYQTGTPCFVFLGK